ncbi:MAG TPA: transposase [Puia sp.]|jgi:putative transposase|nr:transposase [Puia sp.]
MVILYVHVIWCVRRREALLSKPVRRVLLAHMQKEGGEKGLKVVAAGAVEDHLHCLLQLLPSQNLLQVVKSLRASTAAWLNETQLLSGEFAWEEEYFAYSVSPSGIGQVIDFIGKQEEYHQTKTLDHELDKFKESIA